MKLEQLFNCLQQHENKIDELLSAIEDELHAVSNLQDEIEPGLDYIKSESVQNLFWELERASCDETASGRRMPLSDRIRSLRAARERTEYLYKHYTKMKELDL